MYVVVLEPPKSCHRRVAIVAKAQGEDRYVRQQGEPGRYGHIVLSVEPATDESFTLEWAVDDASSPSQYINSVIRGIQACCEDDGPLVLFQPTAPFRDCRFERTRVRVVGGSSHPVDSDELSYAIAAARAFAQA